MNLIILFQASSDSFCQYKMALLMQTWPPILLSSVRFASNRILYFFKKKKTQNNVIIASLRLFCCAFYCLNLVVSVPLLFLRKEDAVVRIIMSAEIMRLTKPIPLTKTSYFHHKRSCTHSRLTHLYWSK